MTEMDLKQVQFIVGLSALNYKGYDIKDDVESRGYLTAISDVISLFNRTINKDND